MLPTLTSNDPLQGLLREKHISFNMRRASGTYSQFPRKVTLFNPNHLKNTIVPGVKEHSESELSKELKKYQDWREVKRYSFPLSPHLFSLLWRFRKDQKFISNEVSSIKPLKKADAKNARNAYKRYRASLQSNLKPGQVYLFPDAEVTFQRPGRYRHGYSRRVLIMNVRNDQIVMIPFSTKLNMINKQTDILFNPGHEGPRLNPSGNPAVENFPYKIFSQQVALCVSAAQPITKEDFLEAALVSMGPLERKLLDFVREKMK